MAVGVNTLSKTFVWILMGMLVVGLAGFGALNLSGTVRTVATVGDQTVSVDDYARELQREIRAFEAQIGQQLPISQVRLLGLDQRALSQLVAIASIDNEVAELGLSIGDVNLQKEILQIQAFNGVNGQFDRESYRFALQQANINESTFENNLRAEAARTLVQGAVTAGVVMPKALVDTIANYVAARRSFSMLRLDTENLTEPLAVPTDAELRAFYEANPDDFTLPETKKLTYVQLTPNMILDQVEVDEETLKNLYDDRYDTYNVPERRLVERLVFPDEASASSAMAQLEVGGTTFEALVAARGLTLADIDMGDLTRDDLDDASDEIFAAEVGSVVGPFPSATGPALYRINGALAEQVTTFEAARAELSDELAGERARREISIQAENIDDLLAGGATLQELADETDMEMGQIDWTVLSYEGIAAYEGFRLAATEITEDDFPEVIFLDDGTIFAMRLDEVLPVRPEPFDQARDRVIAAWTFEKINDALMKQAEVIVANAANGGDLTAEGIELVKETGQVRTAYIDGTPADFMNKVFEMDLNEVRIISGNGAVYVVRLDDILPPDDTEELTAARKALGEQMNQELAQALFQAFVRDAQTRASPSIDQRALNAVMTSFQ